MPVGTSAMQAPPGDCGRHSALPLFGATRQGCGHFDPRWGINVRGDGLLHRIWPRFCGQAIALYLAFPLARFFLQSLYSVLQKKRSWRDRLRLTPQACLDLEAWVNIRRCEGRPLNPDLVPFTGTLAMDASLFGWGATFEAPGPAPPLLARGFFDRELTHINVHVNVGSGGWLCVHFFRQLPLVRPSASSSWWTTRWSCSVCAA